ncbi:YqhG family protein [Virgibacillus halophilus]|uniref:YqhG family protein n=1 Tax=Tigheibacillus halophilus TaxID=361280 RepID=A0ABU5CBI5_9BACI|nr:YqhG family protein [Virgibacillus halophilus]
MNLVNGVMKTEMMDELRTITLQPAISDFCYAISPMIKPGSGFRRILAVLEQFVHDQDHEWAQQSLKALEDEKQLLQAFL